MGLLDQAASGRQIPLTVLMARFQARGMLGVMGVLQVAINDDQKSNFTFEDVTLHGLDQGNPARSMQLAELHIVKAECHVLAFDEMMGQDQTGLMPRQELIAAYTSHFVIQGNVHMGADTPVSDCIDANRSQFVGMTDVTIFPLFPAQAQVIQHAPLAFIHRTQVRMHHSV
jgi:hypothetical protein